MAGSNFPSALNCQDVLANVGDTIRLPFSLRPGTDHSHRMVALHVLFAPDIAGLPPNDPGLLPLGRTQIAGDLVPNLAFPLEFTLDNVGHYTFLLAEWNNQNPVMTRDDFFLHTFRVHVDP